MKKRILSLVLALAMMIGLLIPLGAISVSAETVKSITEFSDSDADGTVYTISSANDLITFAKIGANGKNFANKTVLLVNDIDLNPGWDASVTIGGTVQFPMIPAVTWPNIAAFNGTLDGNGYTISGIYTSKNATGNTGAYGGLFNALTGTIKNLKITNSFILVTNTSWGSKDFHVGGIAGNVNAGAVLNRVYLQLEVWYRSDEQCCLGGAFGFANGQYTVTGCIFESRVGNTSNAYAVNYSTPDGKSIYIGQITGCQNFKEDNSVTNSLSIGTVQSGRNSATGPAHLGVDVPWNLKFVLVGKQDAAFLEGREDYRNAGFVYHAGMGCAVPGEIVGLLDRSLAAQTIIRISTAEDLIAFATSAASGNNFAGKTVYLMNDIDLNPGWSASVTIGGTVQFPSAPAVTWPNIASFNGIFEGNGHTISGLYTSKTVASNTGAYGGLFNTLAGTVKNLAIENSFVLVSNSSWGSGNIHVGGIAGNVEAGAVLNAVYLDAEIWFKSDEQCALGAAFGFANGQYTLKGYVFVGRVGNTSNANAVNYATASGKDIYITQVTGNQNNKNADTVTNSLLAGTVYTGRNSAAYQHLGGAIAGWPDKVWVGQMTAENVAAREDYRNAGFVYHEGIGLGVPGEIVPVLNGTYSAIAEDTPNPSIRDYDGSQYLYEISSVEDLLYAAELSQNGETFSGKVLRLTADIDLNPGWDADVTITNNVATLPRVPTVIFPGFATFAGALDGAGHTISGVFMSKYILEGSSNLAFIEILTGSVRNVKFANSLIFADMKDDSWNPNRNNMIGGVVAIVNSSWNRIYNVYADINVWARTSTYQYMGGIAAKINASDIELNNVIFAGTIGTIAPADNAVPGPDAAVYMSQIVGCGGWKNVAITNFAMNGTCYAKGGVTTTNAIGVDQGGSATVTPGTPTVTAPSVSPVAAFAIWPASGTADRNVASRTDGLKTIRYYENMTAEQFLTWTSSLTSAGYTLVQGYALDGDRNNSFLYQNGVYSVYASFLGAIGTSRARIVVEPYGANHNTANDFASSTRVCEAQIWQLDVDNNYNGSHGGMSYVIRLTNGEFIIIDGGYMSIDEAKNLYSILAANNVLSGKPVIAGWFITHLHSDHFGGMVRFARLYNEKVTVKGFYVNFPSETIGNIAASGNINFVIDHMARFDGAKVYTIHSGMKIGFADATATILATNEDVKQSYWNGGTLSTNDFWDANDTSTVVRFDIKNKAGNNTTKFMVLGDAGDGLDKALRYTWTATELGADIVQVAHHGMNSDSGNNSSTKDVSTALYSTIGASVYLWPAEIVTYESDHTVRELDADNSFHNLFTSHSRTVNVWIKSNAAEVIPAWENVCLTLPYAAGTYLTESGIKSGNTVNTSTAYTRKLDMTNVATIDTCAAQQTTPADNKTSIRFLATVSLDDENVSKLGSFGFDITMIYNGNVYRWTKEVDTIYTSVIAAGATVTATEINDGSNYIFAYVLNEVPANATVEFHVSCFGTLITGETIASHAVANYTVTNGVLAAN
ncbi:MAG: MBL fold metallo-hydrolase [Clostridia bacterium]|nr:MBL fold metallo-hydrolase [Clostridia bacterium]